ncbi:MAG: hypothetical protein WCO89_13265 [Syntrophus sp. (in: bacteria)]
MGRLYALTENIDFYTDSTSFIEDKATPRWIKDLLLLLIIVESGKSVKLGFGEQWNSQPT